MPVLDQHHTGRLDEAQGELLDNLAFCADELNEIYAQSARAYPNFKVPFTEFRDAIANAALKYLALAKNKTGPSQIELKRFVAELQAADLYLGLACLRGDEQAWWEFDRQHRAFIESWTRRLVRGGADADEVMDFVYVELFGTKVTNNLRQSKFRTYTGRGTLRGWLRTIVLHAAVDMYRASKVEVPLEDWTSSEDHSAGQRGGNTEDAMLTSIVRERYRSAAIAALNQALTALDDHENLLLLYYHVEGLKLREIARIVEEPQSPIRRWFQRRTPQRSRVHESTIMRWLERVYRKVADRFHAELAGRHGLKPEEIAICKSIAAEDAAQTITISTVREGLKKKDRVSVERAS
ncbi:MAG TPA: sigma-70 family RNA polymerase sigma factor [Pyrinomonadaceae bacterium]|nr:sigma-70 family RNA polymerase sigma factor [Pyrinomonadaceae bacterium]